MDGFDDTYVNAPVAAEVDDYPPAAQGFEDDQYTPHDAPNGAFATEEFFTEQAVMVDQPPAYTAEVGYDDPFGGAQAATYDAPAIPAPVMTAEEKENDPRSIWGKKNNDLLLSKAAAEEQGKKEQLQKAQEHMDKFYLTRKQSSAARHETNREDEQTKTTDKVPTEGTAWEKITGLINFGFEVHQKDVQRYKACLFACKTNNVTVKA